MRTLRKTIIIALTTLAFGVFLSLMALDWYNYSNRPREPHPESGRIYPERVKAESGIADVYLTRIEKLPYDYINWILPACFALFATAYCLNQRWKVFRHSREHIPKKLY